MLRSLFRPILLACSCIATLSSCALPPSSYGPSSYFPVVVNSIAFNVYQDVRTGVLIKTLSCGHYAVMEPAILEIDTFDGMLYFKDGTYCLVVF